MYKNESFAWKDDRCWACHEFGHLECSVNDLNCENVQIALDLCIKSAQTTYDAGEVALA